MSLPRKQQVWVLSTIEDESAIDLNPWDYAWSPSPTEGFDICDDMTMEDLQAMRESLVDYGELFYTDGKRMGCAKVPPFHTELLPGSKPQFRNQYRQAPREHEKIQRQIADMLEKRVIRKSRSPCSSPISLVKKDGKTAWRLAQTSVGSVPPPFQTDSRCCEVKIASRCLPDQNGSPLSTSKAGFDKCR